MKKTFLLLIITLLIFSLCAFTTEDVEKPIEQIDELQLVMNSIAANDYSINELESFIKEHEDNQHNAHQLAQFARKLGWPENSETILLAKEEWHSSEDILTVYRAEYDKKKNDKWAIKEKEYPAATYIWRYLSEEVGLNDYVCAGIIGNIMTEVGGQTLNIRYDATGNGYYGMCQWSKTYRQVWGADLATQCVFLRDTMGYEFNTYGSKYKKGFKYADFIALQDEKQAALAFSRCYERCGSGSYDIRQKNATIAYNYFVGN